MNEPVISRVIRTLRPSICASCRSKLNPRATIRRPFSNTSKALASGKPASDRPYLESTQNISSVSPDFSDLSLEKTLDQKLETLIPDRSPNDEISLAEEAFGEEPRHHLHVYATKHNTHITLTKPNRDALISMSCGNIGFRKAGRGNYDAAYQLAAFVMSRIQDKGLLTQIKNLELVYRGFGPGREAVTKAILGSEGRNIRGKIVRLTDYTRLKFGGTRSPAPRRLG